MLENLAGINAAKLELYGNGEEQEDEIYNPLQ